MKSPIIALASVLSVCCIIWINQETETKETSMIPVAHTLPAAVPDVPAYSRIEKETFIDPSLQQLAIRLGTPVE